MAVCMDASVKPCNFANAGCSQNHILPSTDSYLGSNAAAVLSDFEKGILVSKAATATSSAAAAAAVEAGGQAAVQPCSTALSCSREVAGTRGEVARGGMVVAVCPCGLVGENMALPLVTAEQHYYYDCLGFAVLSSRPDIQHVYLDIACRYYARFIAMVEVWLDDPATRASEDWKQVIWLLPWMHACDHDLDCQLRFSGLYRELAGHCDGESTERAWALTKALGKLLRYATTARWWDQFNAHFALVTESKQRGLPALLASQLTANQKRLGACPAACPLSPTQAPEPSSICSRHLPS